MTMLAGVDEAGRGPVIGPLVVAAAMIDNDEILKRFKTIIEYHSFWNLVNQNDELKYKAAIIYAEIQGKELDKFILNQNNQPGFAKFNEIKRIWLSSNETHAKEIYDLIKENDKFDLIWKLSENPKILLLTNLIKIGIQEKNYKFFQKDNLLENFNNGFSFIKNETKAKDVYIRFFEINFNLTDVILNTKNEDLKVFISKKGSYELLKTSKNKDLIRKIFNTLTLIKKEEWDEILKNQNNELNVIKFMADYYSKTNVKKVRVSENFEKSLNDFVIKIISGKISNNFLENNIKEKSNIIRTIFLKI